MTSRRRVNELIPMVDAVVSPAPQVAVQEASIGNRLSGSRVTLKCDSLRQDIFVVTRDTCACSQAILRMV